MMAPATEISHRWLFTRLPLVILVAPLTAEVQQTGKAMRIALSRKFWH